MSDIDTTTPDATERTMLAKIITLLLAVSAVGFVVSVIGHLADWKGFDDGGESTVAGSTFWFMYFFAGIASLVVGLVALVRGLRGGAASEKRAGLMAIGYVVATVALIAILDSVT